MNSIVPIFLLLTVSGLVHAQGTVPGVYKTFEEFRSHRPSIELSAEIKEFQVDMENNFGSVTMYRIRMAPSFYKPKQKVFGISDGKDFYIKVSGHKTGKRSNFAKTELVGPYLLFTSIGWSSATGRAGDEGSMSETLTYPQDVLLDQRTGVRINLTRKTLREIIADDEALLERFENEKKKWQKLRQYLKAYFGMDRQ